MVILENISASRILFLFPTPSKSHVIVAHGLSKALSEKGHDVTVVSPFPLSKPIKNHREIKLNLNPEFDQILSQMVKVNQSRFKLMLQFLDTIKGMTNDMLDLPEFKKLMAEENFDLVVIGIFMNNFLLGFGEHFNCPTMILSVNVAMTQTNILFGNPLSVATVPHILSGFSTPMNFFERVKSFLWNGSDFLLEAYFYRWQKKLYE